MARITFFAQDPEEKEFFTRELSGNDLDFVGRPLDDHHLPERRDVDIISVFVGSSISKSVLESVPRLRLVATQSTGFDHIDLRACAERDVLVSNVPTYGARTVAEYTFGLLLMLTRKIPQAAERVRSSYSFSLEGLRGIDLRGKTLGVIGTGHIGGEVISIAVAFDMKVIAFDADPRQELAAALRFTYVSLDRLLSASDIITLHVPHVASTHHLLNESNMKSIRAGALLINTARGPVVETSALIRALESGILAGAALDVLEEEGAVREERELLLRPQPEQERLRAVLQNHLLIRMKNVIVTPHNAFNTTEALHEIMHTTTENIRAFLRGSPQNLVRYLHN